MKRFLRCVCFVLIFAMTVPIFASASEVINTRASSYFAKSTAYLYYTSDTTFYVCFSVTGVQPMDEIGANFIKVQRRASEDEEWTTVRTFTKENYTNLVDYNQTTHSAEIIYYGTAGYEYRAYIELYAKNSSGEGFYPRYAYKL